MPVVSVIMPVRNGERYAGAAVASILNQTLTDLELIVVDDGSTDATAQVVDGAARADGRVRVVSGPALGIAAALETARALAKGAYIARMDSDDIALPGRLEAQVVYLDHHPSVVAVGGQVRLIDDQDGALQLLRYPQQPSDCRSFLAYGSPFCHPAVTMRREALELCGGYRSQFEPAEDIDLWLRLSRHGDFANLTDTVLRYRVHAGSVTTTRKRVNAAASAAGHVSDRFGVERAAAVTDAIGGESWDWRLIENAMEPEYRLFARAAYLRALILNGGITDEREFSLLIDSLPRLYRENILGRDVLAFMLVRSSYQLARAGKLADSVRVLEIGRRAGASALGRELSITLRDKLFPQANARFSSSH